MGTGRQGRLFVIRLRPQSDPRHIPAISDSRMPLAAWVTARTPASEQATFACLTPGLSDALGLQRLRFAGQRLADNQCGKNADIHGEENQGKAPAQPGTPQPPSSSLPMGRASRQKEAASILERPFIGRRKHADVTGFAGWLLLFHMPSDLPLFCRARTDAFGNLAFCFKIVQYR